MTEPSLPIDRWLVFGRIVNLAPLSMRSGEKSQIIRKDGVRGENALVATDYLGRPYLPATAIKGMVRAIAAGRVVTKDESDTEPGPSVQEQRALRLFGDLPRTGRRSDPLDPESSQAQGGSAEFRDAFTATPADAALFERGQTSIDRKRGTAEHERLRQGDFASENLHFDVEIVLDRVKEEDVQLLCSLLGAIDGECPEARLGGGGGAPVRFIDGEVMHLGKNEIGRWLNSEERQWRLFGRPVADAADWFKPLEASAGYDEIALHLRIEGHFLVARENPDHARAKAEGKQGGPDHVPLSPTTQPATEAWLPQSSLKGALRAQAERICRTLCAPAGRGPVVELFGSTDRAGLLKCGDLRGDGSESKVQLDMVAIDRLTGSAAGGAKYAIEAWEAPELRGLLRLMRERSVNNRLTGKPAGDQPKGASDAAIGLLALVLRDLDEGDIALGYGARKGFGRVLRDSWGWQEAFREVGRVEEGVRAFRAWAKAEKEKREKVAEPHAGGGEQAL